MQSLNATKRHEVMKLQHQEEEKNEKYIRKLIRKTPKTKDTYHL